MTRTIEPVFSRTENSRFLKLSFAVHDSESNVVFPISPADFEGIEDLTDDEIMRVVNETADAMAQLRDEQ
ncbi:hypothetical protein GS636_21740 [Ruegeria sp. HKCCD4884]|uniref:hypothetical protein n=1 Tax=Ruegeria sp. HKCCD4884 TaxID=2683022 RepID=UPI0014908CE3|nr:hypothetical protein [Ruegeria sp. HKCCD4884]NOD95430.1 hypothetical protein [Ruegeria sp. HKCCD4884]